MLRLVEKWDLTDEAFREEREGEYIAQRNPGFSIFARFLGFSVRQLFSIVALLPAARFSVGGPGR